MRIPKGFGRNYFTLSAIQAYSSHARLQAERTALDSRRIFRCREGETVEEEEEELLCTETPARPSHPGQKGLQHRFTLPRTVFPVRRRPNRRRFRFYRHLNSVLSPPTPLAHRHTPQTNRKGNP